MDGIPAMPTTFWCIGPARAEPLDGTNPPLIMGGDRWASVGFNAQHCVAANVTGDTPPMLQRHRGDRMRDHVYSLTMNRMDRWG